MTSSSGGGGASQQNTSHQQQQQQKQQQQQRFQECVEEGSRAMKRGDFARAIQQYGVALELDPYNHLVFSNRALAYIKTKQFELALQDARKAKSLKPAWPKVCTAQRDALRVYMSSLSFIFCTCNMYVCMYGGIAYTAADPL